MAMMQEFQEFEKNYPRRTMLISEKEFSYRYYENGDTTLVLLTGGLGFSDLFFTHYKVFSKKYSVLTFDYPYGFPTNIELADAIAELINKLGIKKVYLVGQSYGGLIGQVIAKFHPEVVEGLIFSNTGSLSSSMGSEGKICMNDMIMGLRKTVRILKFLPISLLKPIMLKKLMGHIKDLTDENKIFMSELFQYAVKILTSRHELHMCRLMIDLNNQWDMTAKDFILFKDKVLLILSNDDATFNNEVKQSLIDIMPNPIVKTGISGGHLALFLKIEDYVKIVEDFVDSRETYQK